MPIKLITWNFGFLDTTSFLYELHFPWTSFVVSWTLNGVRLRRRGVDWYKIMDLLSIAVNSAALKASCHEVHPYSPRLRALFKIKSRIQKDHLEPGTRPPWSFQHLGPAWLHLEVPFSGPDGPPICQFRHVAKCSEYTGKRQGHSQGLKNGLEPIVNSGRKWTFLKVYAKAWALGSHIGSISAYRGLLNALLKALKFGVNM